MRVAAVVVAAGRGTRFGGPKQFAPLGARTVAAESVARARSVADYVVLVVPPGYQGDGEGADVVVEGGDSRADSVRRGLAQATEAEVVVVHDAARPRAGVELFEAVVAAVAAGADGAVPGLAVTDTLKRVVERDGSLEVVGTEPREGLVAVQTPQAFAAAILRRAHATRAEATDDAALVEALGGRVVVVPGDPANVKITEPADLAALVGGAR